MALTFRNEVVRKADILWKVVDSAVGNRILRRFVTTSIRIYGSYLNWMGASKIGSEIICELAACEIEDEELEDRVQV